MKITEKAKQALKKLANNEESKNIVFKIVQKGFGWGGPRMGLVQVEPNDSSPQGRMEIDNVKIIWDEEVEDITKTYGEIIIDYIKGIFSEQFTIKFERVFC